MKKTLEVLELIDQVSREYKTADELPDPAVSDTDEQADAYDDGDDDEDVR